MVCRRGPGGVGGGRRTVAVEEVRVVVWCGRDEGVVQVCVVGGQMKWCCSAGGTSAEDVIIVCCCSRFLWMFLVRMWCFLVRISCFVVGFFVDVCHLLECLRIGHVTLPKLSSLPCW